MRASERLKLLEQIGSELQSRYTFAEIDMFFSALNISTENIEGYGQTNSKRVYSKAVLAHASEPDILRVGHELDIVPVLNADSTQTPPANWEGTHDFRLFISHISKDKGNATRLKGALADYAISGFVAHEDILPTLSWQDEIERALKTMDALIAVHTEGFSASVWTQQEIGYALGHRLIKRIQIFTAASLTSAR